MSPYLRWLAGRFAERSGVDPAFAAADRHVIGYATGYSAEQLAPFVRSLRAHFDGAITLVVDADPALRGYLSEHGVIAVEPEAGEGWSPHVVVSRLATFSRLLSLARPDSCVLLTDVRDVVFQGDPLSPRPTTIEAFDEQDGGRMADHSLNQKYMRALVGGDVAGLLSDQAAVCVGTVAGPAAALARLCRVMLMLSAQPRSALGGAFGADQASFNLAVHLDLVEAEVQPNFSRVATVGVPASDRMRVVEGVMVNPDGTVSPVVHQYDRHPHLLAAVNDRWGVSMGLRPRRHANDLASQWSKHVESVRKRIPELR